MFQVLSIFRLQLRFFLNISCLISASAVVLTPAAACERRDGPDGPSVCVCVCVCTLASVHLAAALVSCLCGLESVDVLCLASGAASKRSIDGCETDRVDRQVLSHSCHSSSACAKVNARSEVKKSLTFG